MWEIRIHDWFTIDKRGEVGKDKTLVPYLYMPSSSYIKFDLNRKHPEDSWKTEADLIVDHIDILLKWVIANCNDWKGQPSRIDAEFVAYRGLLSKILRTPYESQDDVRICAIKAKETIYLCKFYTETTRAKEVLRFKDTEQMKLSRYGHVFEKYMVFNKPGMRPDVSQPLSQFEEFYGLYKAKVGGHKLMYIAEVDGIEKEDDLKNLNESYLYELKTCKENLNPHTFARFKTLDWWAQSVLAKVDSVVVGYRTNAGYVVSLQKYQVNRLPSMTMAWSVQQCELALQKFLNLAKETMCDAKDGDVYEFFWRVRGANFTARKLPKGNNCYFLPLWYQEWMAKMP